MVEFLPNIPNTQTTLRSYASNIPPRSQPIFGEAMLPKEDGICRIVSQNVGCLGVQAFGNNKLRTAKEWLIHHQIDICGWQEIGFANHVLKRHERMAERMRDLRWKGIRISTATNKNESIDRFQWGGTSVMSFDLFAHMTKSTGVDQSGLGRWSWLLLEGHRGARIRVISAYNPFKTKPTQTTTVYAQHKRYFLEKNLDVCPRIQFRKDLCEFISTCPADSEDIILLMDCNENLIKFHDLHKHITDDPISLIDPIRYKYFSGAPLPPTHEHGSFPIDAIFVSYRLLDITCGGWLKFGDGVGDHRPLYIDIPVKRLLGRYKNVIYPHQIRRLRCQDPRTVVKYNDILEQQYHHHNTITKLDEFQSLRSDPVTDDDLERLYKIDRTCTQAVRCAEKRC